MNKKCSRHDGEEEGSRAVLETETWREGPEGIDPRHNETTLTLLVEPDDTDHGKEEAGLHRVWTR